MNKPNQELIFLSHQVIETINQTLGGQDSFKEAKTINRNRNKQKMKLIPEEGKKTLQLRNNGTTYVIVLICTTFVFVLLVFTVL